MSENIEKRFKKRKLYILCLSIIFYVRKGKIK
jgi:hypothetical protein